MTTAVGPKSAIPTICSQTPQDFYQNIYLQLRTGQLTSAIEAVRHGKSSQSSLSGNNVTMITDYLSKEGLTDIERANKLINLIKLKPKTFLNVNAELFSSSIPAGQIVAAKPIKPSTADANSKILEKVKALGKQEGLTDQEVNDALEEIVEDDGSITWMVKVFHHPKYDAWQDALDELTSQEEMILFYEGSHVNAWDTQYVKGLETDMSRLRMAVSQHYADLSKIIITGNIDAANFKKAAGTLLDYLSDGLENSRCTMRALIEVKSKSKIAEALLQKLMFLAQKGINLDEDPSSLNTFDYFCNLMLREFPQPKEWLQFYELLLPVVYKNCNKEILAAMNDMIASVQRINKQMPNSVSLDTRERRAYSLSYFNFLEIECVQRDIDYASVYRSERPKMPKGRLAFVTFGTNHGPGFKAALLGKQIPKPEGKYNIDKGDEKASVAQTAQKASGKTESSSNTKTG